LNGDGSELIHGTIPAFSWRDPENTFD
jgi:hypothetical protein